MVNRAHKLWVCAIPLLINLSSSPVLAQAQGAQGAAPPQAMAPQAAPDALQSMQPQGAGPGPGQAGANGAQQPVRSVARSAMTRSSYPDAPPANQAPTAVRKPGGYNHYDPTAFIPRDNQPGGAMSTNHNSPGLTHQHYTHLDNYTMYGLKPQTKESGAAPAQTQASAARYPGATQMYSQPTGAGYGKNIRF